MGKIRWGLLTLIFWMTAIILFILLLVLVNFGLSDDKATKLGYTFITFAILGIVFSICRVLGKKK
jgi:TM2 domain-containing membrane protein YozV